MQTTYESLRAFVSSPRDVVKERTIVKKVINAISATCKESLGLEIECVTWDDCVPQTTKLPEETIQDILNAEIPKCQMFILILWKRYGSTEPGHRKSNTERETEVALDLLKREKKIMFLTYFRDVPAIDDTGPQQKSVEKFRKQLQGQGIWYKRYSSPSDFHEILTHDIYRTVLRYRLSTKKHRALRKFWVFGIPDRPTHPKLAVIYPSMERTFMGAQDDPYVWLNRLEPNVVFEDFKALQKIDKTLNLLGFKDFRIFNSSNIPSDINFMNRFWICLPRNTRGLEQTKIYKDVSRFEMIRRKKRVDSYIKWKPSVGKNQFIVVRSPLSKYLREQRSRLNISGDWRYDMDHIIAKDFAILARFSDTRNNVAMEDYFLQDYFLAGLRGLGTWGAAWFVDRKYQVFETIDEKQDFQFLLEVEYRDGRVFDVRDVSGKPQAYFDDENSMTKIRKRIAAYVPC